MRHVPQRPPEPHLLLGFVLRQAAAGLQPGDHVAGIADRPPLLRVERRGEPRLDRRQPLPLPPQRDQHLVARDRVRIRLDQLVHDPTQPLENIEHTFTSYETGMTPPSSTGEPHRPPSAPTAPGCHPCPATAPVTHVARHPGHHEAASPGPERTLCRCLTPPPGLKHRQNQHGRPSPTRGQPTHPLSPMSRDIPDTTHAGTKAPDANCRCFTPPAVVKHRQNGHGTPSDQGRVKISRKWPSGSSK